MSKFKHLQLLLVSLFSSASFVFSQPIGWTNIAEGGTYSATEDLVYDENQGTILSTGLFDGTVDFDPSTGIVELTSTANYSTFIQKTDSSGNFIWCKGLYSDIQITPDKIIVDDSSNVYVVGSYFGTADMDPGPGVFNIISSGIRSGFVLKLDALGNFIWAYKIGGIENTSAHDIAFRNGKLYISGLF